MSKGPRITIAKMKLVGQEKMFCTIVEYQVEKVVQDHIALG